MPPHTRIPHTYLDYLAGFFVLLGIATLADSEEYCLTDTFKAECPRNQVLLIQSAQFGRMRLGGCVTRNFGYVGCYVDVLRQLDEPCSGRISCSISVSHDSLVRTTPCPKDFANYLEAVYTCVPVIKVPVTTCKDSLYNLPPGGGYISSAMVSPCPLQIKVASGQRVNLTLLDFSTGNPLNLTQSDVQGRPDEEDHRGLPPDLMEGDKILQFCQQYALVEEPQLSSTQTLCGGTGVRVKQVYLSRTNTIHIQLFHTKATFLIKYQAVGCADPVLPTGTYVKYDRDVAHIFCNGTNESFKLKCEDNKWTGPTKNCTPIASVSPGYFEDDKTYGGLPPVGISIVIIFGVALVIVVYVAIMIVCVLFIRKRRKRQQREAALQDSNVFGPKMTGVSGPELTGQLHLHLHHQQQHKVSPATIVGGNCGNQEERLPMLLKPNCIRTNTGASGEYTDFCELHDIKPLGDGNATYAVRGTYTVGSLHQSPQLNSSSIYDTSRASTLTRTSSVTSAGQKTPRTAQIDRTRLYESSRTMRALHQDLDQGFRSSPPPPRSVYYQGDYGEAKPSSVALHSGLQGSCLGPDLVPEEGTPPPPSSSCTHTTTTTTNFTSIS